MNLITKNPWIAGLFGLLGCCAAIAQTQLPHVSGAVASAVTGRTELSLDRLEEPASPQWVANQLDITHWSSAERSGIGMSLGMQASAFAGQPNGVASASADWAPRLGAHWRTPFSGGWRLDVSAWVVAKDALGWRGDKAAAYTTRVEVQWKSARHGGLLPEYGAVGVQLQGGSDARLLLRARHGGPMVYYRARF